MPSSFYIFHRRSQTQQNTTRRRMSCRELHEIARGKLARCISDAGKITTLEGKRKKGWQSPKTTCKTSRRRGSFTVFSKVRAIWKKSRRCNVPFLRKWLLVVKLNLSLSLSLCLSLFVSLSLPSIQFAKITAVLGKLFARGCAMMAERKTYR